ncbi:MAG: histidine kinase [Rhodobacteraceae bacterium]|nr:histidine kinase [Paracoccaceae bacterium]
MTGKLLTLMIVVCSLLAGAAMYYFQVYGYYFDVPEDQHQVSLTSVNSGNPEVIETRNFTGIDADSSPIRYRACFETDVSIGMLTETYVVLEKAEPRLAPKWFECFDAKEIGQDLEAGTAVAFMGTRNLRYGIDRIVAIYPDGRGYAWHQVNKCGEKQYDGSPVDPTCPKGDQ